MLSKHTRLAIMDTFDDIGLWLGTSLIYCVSGAIVLASIGLCGYAIVATIGIIAKASGLAILLGILGLIACYAFGKILFGKHDN